jgi:hypothetical protein
VSLYAVALKAPQVPTLAPAPALAAAGKSPGEAAAFLRSNPGFLGRRLLLADARALADTASLSGFPAIIAAEADLPAPPAAIFPEKIELANDGFYASAAGTRHFIPYDSVTVIAAAAYEAPVEPATLSALKAGLLARIAALTGRPGHVSPPQARETFLLADIIGGPGPLRLRLKPEDLDFSPLGRELSPSSEANFRKLMGEIAARSFRAAGSACLTALLANRPLGPLRYSGASACDEALTSLLLAAGAENK